jgi:hypothetical protein
MTLLWPVLLKTPARMSNVPQFLKDDFEEALEKKAVRVLLVLAMLVVPARRYSKKHCQWQVWR